MAPICYEEVLGLGLYYLSHNTHFSDRETDLAIAYVFAAEYSVGHS